MSWAYHLQVCLHHHRQEEEEEEDLRYQELGMDVEVVVDLQAVVRQQRLLVLLVLRVLGVELQVLLRVVTGSLRLHVGPCKNEINY